MATVNTFSFVGKITPVKEKNNFKTFTEQIFDSGWKNQKLRFNVVAGSNRHLVEINAGCWNDDAKNTVVYTMSKGRPSEKLTIPWEQRNDPAELDKVAGYRLFTVDTDTYQHRQKLEEDGKDEEWELSMAKRKHFMTGVDFIDYMRKVLQRSDLQDMRFRINGNITYTYNAEKGKYYNTYEVTKVYRVDDSVQPTSDVSINFYYTEDFIGANASTLNGYTQFYHSDTKSNWFTPISIAIDKDKLAGAEELMGNFIESEVCYSIISCQAIDGVQKRDVMLSDLPEKIQRAVALGMKQEEDALREARNQAFGDSVKEIRFTDLGSKFGETTAYQAEALTEKPHIKVFNDDEI